MNPSLYLLEIIDPSRNTNMNFSDRNSLCKQLKLINTTFNKILDKKDSELESLRKKMRELALSVKYIPMRSTITEEYLVPVKDINIY